MNCYIVTGAARGLGLGFAQTIADRGAQLIGVGRQESPALSGLGREISGYRFAVADLGDSQSLTETADELFGSLAAINWEGIFLINNAGVVEPVAPTGRYDDAEALHCLTVNLSATMQLCNAFVRHFQDRPCDKRIMNISSGAGRKPYAGMSAYCASKAGLDMFSRCVGEEQHSLPHGIRIASVAPGIVDTGMQADIRTHSVEDFPLVERWHGFKANHDLAEPRACAEELIRLLHSEHFGFGNILDIRDFRKNP